MSMVLGLQLEMKLYLEKSVGTTELHYSTKKREHCFSILKAFFRPTLVRV